MEDTFILTELAQVKALADPLHIHALKIFCQQPTTTMQVALILGEKPAKLYYRVKALERVGLIKMVKTRQTRGTVEKYYQSVARQFSVDRKLFEVTLSVEGAAGGVEALFIRAIEDSLTEIRKSVRLKLIKPQDEGSTAVLTRSHIRATKEQIGELIEKLQGWLEECRVTHSEEGEAQYALTVAFYPVEHQSKGRSGGKKSGGKGKKIT